MKLELNTDYLITENTELGAGIAYQNHGEIKKDLLDVEDKNLKVGVEPLKLYDSVPLSSTSVNPFNFPWF